MSKDKGCAGTYYVCGYTRGDGTEVCGYYRTCGAMHNSDTESTNSKTNNAKNGDIGLGYNPDNIIAGDFSSPYNHYIKEETSDTVDKLGNSISNNSSKNNINSIGLGSNNIDEEFSSPYRFYARVEENHNANEIDTYTQDLIDEVKNTEVEVKGMGKIKAGDLIPNIEKYIEDTRTKMEKRADRIYGSMKNNIKRNINIIKNHPEIKLYATAFPYFVERMNQELEAKGKQKVENIEVMESYEWELFTKNVSEALKQWKTFIGNPKELNAAASPYKFLNNLQGEEKRLEDLKEMIDDYVNGSIFSEGITVLAGIRDAGGLLRINGKDSDMNTLYTLWSKKYKNPNELPEKFKNTIKSKLKSQGLSENSKGLYFNSISGLSKRVAQSQEMINLIKKEKNKIQPFFNYDRKKVIPFNNRTSIEYKPNNPNMYYAFHYADVHNLKYDIFGNITGDLIDTTDFNKGKNEPPLIQVARELQDESKIEPKFVIVHFVIPKSVVNKKH